MILVKLLLGTRNWARCCLSSGMVNTFYVLLPFWALLSAGKCVQLVLSLQQPWEIRTGVNYLCFTDEMKEAQRS